MVDKFRYGLLPGMTGATITAAPIKLKVVVSATDPIAWGDAVNGLKFGAVLDRTVYKPDHKVFALTVITNITDKPILFLTPAVWDGGWFITDDRGKVAWQAGHYWDGVYRDAITIEPHDTVCFRAWGLASGVQNHLQLKEGKYLARFDYKMDRGVFDAKKQAVERAPNAGWDDLIARGLWTGGARSGEASFEVKSVAGQRTEWPRWQPGGNTLNDQTDTGSWGIRLDFPIGAVRDSGATYEISSQDGARKVVVDKKTGRTISKK